MEDLGLFPVANKEATNWATTGGWNVISPLKIDLLASRTAAS
jgi:hypothetical protein